MAELVVKLSQKLEPQSARTSEGEEQQQGIPGPNRDRLTVGVDLGDRWSNFCILGLDGEKLTKENCAPHKRISRNSSRQWLPQRVVYGSGDAFGLGAGCGGELRSAKCWWLTRGRWKGRSGASARMIESMPTSWREVGRMDPQSLFAIEHRSVEVRQDLMAVRARDAVVAVRKDLINTTRGLVKSMERRGCLKCSTRSCEKVEGRFRLRCGRCCCRCCVWWRS